MKQTGGFSEPERELVLGIVRALPDGELTLVTREDADLMIVELPETSGLKLRLLAFARQAIAELLSDSAREVKVEYLKRDLRRAARSRREYRYPRQLALRGRTFPTMRAEAERVTRMQKAAMAV